MKIGNLAPFGEQVQLNKWYFGVEICMHAPFRGYRGFALRPWFLVVCTKVTHLGTLSQQIEGTMTKKKGGWFSVEFPFGVEITLI